MYSIDIAIKRLVPKKQKDASKKHLFVALLFHLNVNAEVRK
jgi:hypothetical protein